MSKSCSGKINKTRYDDPRKPMKPTSFIVKTWGETFPKSKWGKATIWITASISAIVSEETKDGPVGTDESKGHTAAARGREALVGSKLRCHDL